MCGVFGVVSASVGLNRSDIELVARTLLLSSEIRGSEAAGVAGWSGADVAVAKSDRPAHEFVRGAKFRSILRWIDQPDSAVVIGHARLVTNGSAIFADNNQPVSAGELTLVHNGIVTNHHSLKVDDVGDSDSAAVVMRLAALIEESDESVEAAFSALFGEINGSATLAVIDASSDRLVIGTNTGSLYVGESHNGAVVVFASEHRILDQVLKSEAGAVLQPVAIRHVDAGTGLSIDRTTGSANPLTLAPYRVRPDRHFTGLSPVKADTPVKRSAPTDPPVRLRAAISQVRRFAETVRRCTRCILPETVPFITFDDDGVCSYCLSHEPRELRDASELEEVLEPLRDVDGPNCIVAFSGGRDSSYGLHLLVEKHGMQPLALTYDWGMVTDLARRNQARLTGALGVEHILVSADIERKRANIGKNLNAWLKRPELGMVPLLMAGDKQFFLHARRLAEDSGIPLVVFCINPWEMTFFKAGFAGVPDQRYYTSSNWVTKVKLFGYYGRQYLRNPGYINGSLLDTAEAAAQTYFRSHDYLQLFDWVEWDEDHVNKTLVNEYGWETDPSTTTTWRIGDGTAPFYNYVYWRAVGFTESDTFRSNQVREHQLSRDRALELTMHENEPRWDRIREYVDLVGVDFDRAVDGVEALAAKSPVGVP